MLKKEKQVVTKTLQKSLSWLNLFNTHKTRIHVILYPGDLEL